MSAILCALSATYVLRVVFHTVVVDVFWYCSTCAAKGTSHAWVLTAAIATLYVNTPRKQPHHCSYDTAAQACSDISSVYGPPSLYMKCLLDFNPNIHDWKRRRGRNKTRWTDSIKHDPPPIKQSVGTDDVYLTDHSGTHL